eukprot:6947146-Karenia_brevis.AAC.1
MLFMAWVVDSGLPLLIKDNSGDVVLHQGNLLSMEGKNNNGYHRGTHLEWISGRPARPRAVALSTVTRLLRA